MEQSGLQSHFGLLSMNCSGFYCESHNLSDQGLNKKVNRFAISPPRHKTLKVDKGSGNAKREWRSYFRIFSTSNFPAYSSKAPDT